MVMEELSSHSEIINSGLKIGWIALLLEVVAIPAFEVILILLNIFEALFFKASVPLGLESL